LIEKKSGVLNDMGVLIKPLKYNLFDLLWRVVFWTIYLFSLHLLKKVKILFLAIFCTSKNHIWAMFLTQAQCHLYYATTSGNRTVPVGDK